MSQVSSTARETARRLLQRETAGVTEEVALGAALERACTRAAGNLRRSVGDDGYSALLARAFAATPAERTLLNDLRRVDAASIDLDVATGIRNHGVDAAGAAVEALIAAIVDILSDLIGVDMVQNLLDHDEPARRAGDRRTR